MNKPINKTASPCPTLLVLFQLFTNQEGFGRFRQDSRNYLTAQGLSANDPAFAILLNVPRGGSLSADNITSLVELLLGETGSGDTGPRGPLPPSLPLLRSFYAKYIEQKPEDWGPFTGVKESLEEELSQQQLIW